MKKYKLSQYNLIFDRNNQRFLWNTLTNALIKVDSDGIRYLQEFDHKTEEENRKSPYFEPLLKNGCIIPDSYDELGKVLFDEKSTMMNPFPSALHYTIAPGLGCNYACVYCFEKNRDSYHTMDQKTQEDVCAFILNAMDHNPNVKNLGITWFGGEPLLYRDAIAYISQKLMQYCEEKEITYSAGIVTNGRFLTEDVARKLVDLKVQYVQLAVDGMPERYSYMKGTTEDDFYKVVENIEKSAEIIPITVRINVSDNAEDAFSLTDYLLNTRKLDGKIKIYIAHVREYEERVGEEERKSHEDFLRLEEQYMLQFHKDGKYSANSFSYIAPKRRCTTCLTVCSPNYCIGPEGELYRCEHFFGRKDKIVGTIYQGRFYTKEEQRIISFQHPQKCLECKMFPICLGGCMNDCKEGEVLIACEQFKERLKDFAVRKNVILS